VLLFDFSLHLRYHQHADGPVRRGRRQLLLIPVFRSMATRHQPYQRSIVSCVWSVFCSSQHSLTLELMLLLQYYQATGGITHWKVMRSSEKFSHGCCLLFKYSRVSLVAKSHTCQVLSVNISISTWIPADDFALLAQSLDHRQFKFHTKHRIDTTIVGAHQGAIQLLIMLIAISLRVIRLSFNCAYIYPAVSRSVCTFVPLTFRCPHRFDHLCLLG